MDSMFIEQKYLLLISSQLSQFTKKGDYLYNFRCPYCGDSHKSKTKARGYVFRKEQKLLYRCHNCSKGTTLQGLLKHIDVNIYKDYIFEQYKKDRVNKELDGKLTFTQPNFMKGSSPLKSLKKISQLRHDHPVKRFVDSRKIPTKTHFELFFAPKFYKWVNTIIPNKFPSTEGDHPRLVIPFFDENNEFFCFQGRSFGNEKPKYITLKLNPDKNKVYGLNRVDKSKHILVVEGPIDSLFLDNCIAVAGSTNFAKDIPKENTTIVFDNERRNREIMIQVKQIIDKGYNVVLWPDDVKEKDINDMIISGMTKDQIQTIIKNNTYQGNMAKMKFATWKRVDV